MCNINKGKLIVFTGSSGVGKGTIMKELLKSDKKNRLSISVTTRKPRPGEVNGREYYFVDLEEFKEEADRGGFLEYAPYCGNFYGTPQKAVETMLEQGYNVFLEIEVNGGEQIKKKCPNCISIFIMPPSLEELENRLRKRATETEEVINMRLNTALTEINLADRYDYKIVNNQVDQAVKEILEIINK